MFRALLIGCAFSLLTGAGAVYANNVIRGTFMASSFATPAAFFLFFCLLVANQLTRLLSRTLPLRREELATIFIMMLVSASIPTFGLMEHLLPMITGAFYYATPENGWETLIHPHIPGWIAPSDPGLIRGFYEGLPSGEPIPWRGWIEPLSWWLLFLLALYLVSICAVVMLRRQWMERERLAYPMMITPIEMVGPESGESHSSSFFRSPIMWAGFAVPMVVGSLNALSSYFQAVPSVSLTTSLSIFNNSINVPVHFSFPLTGFSYFIHQSLGLGIWVFYWLTLLEQGVFNTVGFNTTERLGWFSNPSSPFLTHQALGAMLMFALFVLWNGRSHLRDVWRKALRGDRSVEDGDEILSYRMTVIGFCTGLAIMLIWLNKAGIPLFVVPVFLAVALLLFLAISRIVVEAGVTLLRAPLIAPDFVMVSFGTSTLGGAGLTGLAYTYPWTADIVTFPMASVANGLKIVDELIPTPHRRSVFWGLSLAVVATLSASCWMVIHLSYTRGGINLMSWFWQYSSEFPLTYIASQIQSPSMTEATGWLFTGLGAAAMWLLMVVQQRVAWWPIHPLGLAISGTVFTSGFMWFSVFVAWLIKVVVLKYGGGALYSRSRFFFMGMILGAFVTSGTWLIVDCFIGHQANAPLGGW